MRIRQVVLIVIIVGIWGGLIRCCVCCFQTDLKAFIAYSSIGHMGVCLGAILRIYSLGKMSAVCLLFAHGLVSPALFSMAAIVYDFVGTRNLVISKGVLCAYSFISYF